jgi:hypothetical protein
MVIVGGASLGTAWALLIALPLYELWFKKARPVEQES